MRMFSCFDQLKRSSLLFLRGEDYSSHIKCITEDQKYGGSNYVSKENKGERKQEEWVMKIKEKVANTQNMEPQLKDLLQRIILHSNIPRKEAKFRVRHVDCSHSSTFMDLTFVVLIICKLAPPIFLFLFITLLG